MNVDVVHGGYEEAVTKVDDIGFAAAQLLHICGNAHDTAVGHANVAVLDHLEMVFLLSEEDMCLIYFHTLISTNGQANRSKCVARGCRFGA